jgi:hypothetical protein
LFVRDISLFVIFLFTSVVMTVMCFSISCEGVDTLSLRWVWSM